MRSVPLLLHPDYLLDSFNYMDPGNLLMALLTGAVRTPVSEMTGGIDHEGRSTVNGPGVIRVSGINLLSRNPRIPLGLQDALHLWCQERGCS